MERKYEDDPADTLLRTLAGVVFAVIVLALGYALVLIFFNGLFWARGFD